VVSVIVVAAAVVKVDVSGVGGGPLDLVHAADSSGRPVRTRVMSKSRGREL